MKTFNISICVNGVIKQATVHCDRKEATLIFEMEHCVTKIYKDEDLFMCFGQLRNEFKQIKFLCKGAKINVFPSRMSSQMSSGVVAYELTLGKTADYTVNIFDYEDLDITNDIRQQSDFYKAWIESLD